MSLKVFHILFITTSIALASGFGIWAVSVDGWGYKLTGLASFACAAGLVVYEVAFLKKCREMGLT
jgi:long-subunit fatty acid transport protein